MFPIMSTLTTRITQSSVPTSCTETRKMHVCSTFQQRNQTFSRYVSRYVDRRTAYTQFLMVHCLGQGKENELGERRIRFKMSFKCKDVHRSYRRKISFSTWKKSSSRKRHQYRFWVNYFRLYYRVIWSQRHYMNSVY